MEIGYPIVRFVGDADSLQVLLHHEPRPAVSELGKERLVGFQTIQPLPKQADQLGMQGQDVLPAVLRAGGFDRVARRPGLSAV